MPTLPQGGSLPPQVEVSSQPGRTWYIDKSTNRIRGECDNWLAVRQAVEEGKIARSRYDSYVAMFEEVKDQKSWMQNPKK